MNRCLDWSTNLNLSSGDGGDVTGQTGQWTLATMGGAPCNTPRRIYCFTRDLNVPLVPPSPPTRIAFLSAMNFSPSSSTTIATADTICQNEAMSSALPGMYRAFLATATASAASRFPRAIFHRPDGYRLGTTDQVLGGPGFDGFLESEINQQANGMYIGTTLTNAWTGMDLGPDVSSAFTCSSWTSNGAASSGTTGLSTSVVPWSDTGNAACSAIGGRRVYCLRYDAVSGGGSDGGPPDGGT